MANFLDLTALPSFTDREAARFIFQPLFTDNPDISRYDVRFGIKSETAVQKFGTLRKITKTAAKGFSSTGTSALTERVISPKRLKAQNAEDAYNIFGKVQEQMLNLSPDKDNLEGTDLRDILFEIQRRAIEDDMMRQLWFADTASGDADYSVYEGIFKRYDSLPAPQKLVFPAGALGTDAAQDEFEKLWDAAPAELKGMKDMAVIECSGNVWDNYVETLEERGTEISDQRLNDGSTGAMWRGIPIIVHRNWDRDIAADALATDVARIVMHVPKNVMIGTDLADSVTNTKTWYNIDDEEYRFRTSYIMDTQYANDELAVTSIAA